MCIRDRQIRERLGLRTTKQVNHAIDRARKARQDPPPSTDLTAAIREALKRPVARGILCDRLKISDRILTAAIEDLRESGIQVVETDGELSDVYKRQG